MSEKQTKEHNKVQKNVERIRKIQDKFGGYKPDLINIYFAAKLECLTLVLIILTAILSILTIAQIILLTRSF